MITNVFPNPTDAARAHVERILNLIKAEDQDEYHIALSGGSTPALMFDLWAKEYSHLTPWKKLRFYWVDERCVAPDDAESNYGMAYQHLLSKVPVPESHIYRIDGENEPEEECKRYSELVSKKTPLEDGLPVFDIVLLGAGDDGHTSSIFPGQEHLLTTSEIYAVGVHPESGQKRIALTGKPIMNAKHVIFFVTGEKKKSVVLAIKGVGNNGPAAYVAHHAKHAVEIFTDNAAADEG